MIVIPMAGASSRFTQAGYGRPKFMLDLHGRPVFDFAVGRFADLFQSEAFLFIARRQDGLEEFVRTRLAALGVRQSRLVILDQPTAGQAETVEAGLLAAGVQAQTRLDIFNIDTFACCGYRDPGQRFPHSAGHLEVIRASGNNWSFVEPAPDGSSRAIRTAEKLAISDLCCTGLYGFTHAEHFLDALARERQAPQSHELFVAPLYNHLISAGLRVDFDLVDADDILLCGVPAEYEHLSRATPQSLPHLFALDRRLDEAAAS